jgi:hypothetical protein
MVNKINYLLLFSYLDLCLYKNLLFNNKIVFKGRFLQKDILEELFFTIYTNFFKNNHPSASNNLIIK